MLFKLLFSSIVLPICFAYFIKRYDNYALLIAVPETQKQLEFFQRVERDGSYGVDFWVYPGSVNHSISMIVPPENKSIFLDKTEILGIEVTTMLKNIQWAFDEQKPRLYIRRSMDTFDWYNYYGIEGIYSWLRDLVDHHGNTSKLINIGKSFEGRDIIGIHIPSKSAQAIFIEGGIHAREWISPAFVTYLIYQLVTADEDGHVDLLNAVKKYSWHIFPVVNPDGYAFTHYRDRNWRKNRRKFAHGQFGVDLNRNFDYSFNSVGVSQNPADETYCGAQPFSEPESKAISDYVNTIGRNLVFYMSFHSFGQHVIIPYADSAEHTENFNQVKNLVHESLNALKSLYQTVYDVGTAYDTIGYRVSGNSVDWAKKKYKIPVAVDFELRDKGLHGFALPLSEILPTCKETMACVLEMVNLGPNHISPMKVRPLNAASSEIRSFSENKACIAIVVTLNIFLYG